MNHVCHIVWQAAGAPPGEGATDGQCRICGGSDLPGLPFGDWMRPTFNDLDKIRPGDIICQACQFSFAERSPLLTQRTGKDKLQRMRNYSHFVIAGAWYPLSKGAKSHMIELLHQAPEVAIIAASGQKHLIFRAQPGWWQFEEHALVPQLARLDALLQPLDALLTGFSKDEIATGNYAQHRIYAFGVAEWNALERTIAPHRGALLFGLALFLAQKGDADDGSDSGFARNGSRSADGDLARDAARLQEPLPNEHLATVRGPGQIGGLYQQPGQVRQLTMF